MTSRVLFFFLFFGCGSSPAAVEGDVTEGDSALEVETFDTAVVDSDLTEIDDGTIDDAGPLTDSVAVSDTKSDSATVADAKPDGLLDAPLDAPPDAPLDAPLDATADAKPDVAVAAPSLGAHTLAFYRYHANDKTSITTLPMAVQASGSTVVVGIGRGEIGAFSLPTNSKSSAPFTQLGATHAYTKWPTSGTASYALRPVIGGKDFSVSASTAASDEITLAAIEVRDSTKIQASAWNEVTSGPLKSASVTTTGPATLIAFWWGDAFVDYAQTASPNNGFTVIDSLLEAGSLVQCAVATKTVSVAGTYDVTWTATPAQGAQMWLVAVQ